MCPRELVAMCKVKLPMFQMGVGIDAHEIIVVQVKVCESRKVTDVPRNATTKLVIQPKGESASQITYF